MQLTTAEQRSLEQLVGDKRKGVDPTWDKLAPLWSYVRPPLRPCRRDVQVYEQLADTLLSGRKMPTIVLLGVTPEIALMRWPEDTHVVAIERSKAMIRTVFYNKVLPYASEDVHLSAVEADWNAAAVEKADLVIGDGCFTQLRAQEYVPTLRSIQGLLKADGHFVHRFFLKDSDRSPNEVLKQLKVPFSVESFSQLKLDLLRACQNSFAKGVRLGDAFNAWAKWLDKHSWADVKPQHILSEEIATLTCYAGSKKVYTFPSYDYLYGLLKDFRRATADDTPICVVRRKDLVA